MRQPVCNLWPLLRFSPTVALKEHQFPYSAPRSQAPRAASSHAPGQPRPRAATPSVILQKPPNMKRLMEKGVVGKGNREGTVFLSLPDAFLLFCPNNGLNIQSNQ